MVLKMLKQKSSAQRLESYVSGEHVALLFVIIFGFPYHKTTVFFKRFVLCCLEGKELGLLLPSCRLAVSVITWLHA